jgi:hypothetical protein
MYLSMQQALDAELRGTAAIETEADQTGFPRFWALFPCILSRQVRERIYHPAHQDLLQTYLATRGRYRTKWARRWLVFCFTVRTAAMVVDCIAVSCKGKLARLLFALLPPLVKHWLDS